MFTAQLTGHDLHAPDGTTLTASAKSVRERVLDTIGHLDEQAALQSRIIRNALRMEPGMEDAHPTLRCRRTRMRSITQSNSARG